MKKYSLRQKRRGFMTVEVLISASIIVMVVLASTSVAQKSISLSRQALHTEQATYLLEEGAEAVRIIRDNDWNNIIDPFLLNSDLGINFSGGTWNFVSPNNTNLIMGLFKRSIYLNTVYRDATTGDIVTNGGVYDDGTRLVTVIISWPENGNQISKTLSFYISNIFQ